MVHKVACPEVITGHRPGKQRGNGMQFTLAGHRGAIILGEGMTCR